MSDVDTWSPLDESNTSPPPDGWPEFMLPSAVNNCGRAMMGAVRRMYDKQVDGTTVLPYLSTSGGTLTGVANFNAGLTTSTINATGNVSIAGGVGVSGGFVAAGAINCGGPYQLVGQALASRSGNDTYFYDDTGQWTLLTRSTGNNYYSNTGHYFVSRNNGATYASIGSTEANFSVPIKTSNAVQSTRADAFAFHAPNGGATFAGTVTAGGFSSTGSVSVVNLNASGTVTTANLTASGTVTTANLSATGNVSGGYVSSTGNINAANQYTGGAVNVSGEVRGGSLTTGGSATVGAVLTAHDVMPSADAVSICGGASAAWAVVEAYAFITKGAAATLGPLPDTLPLVAAIEPQAYQHGDAPTPHWGFVAQDVRAAIGDLPVDIVRGEEGRLGLDYAGLTAMLWQAVRTLAAKVQQLEGSHV